MSEVTLVSKAFAGKTINVAHIEQSGGTKPVKVKKDKNEAFPTAEKGTHHHAVPGGNKVVFGAPDSAGYGSVAVSESVAEAIQNYHESMEQLALQGT